MPRYFLKLSYNGAPYCGWQRQPADPSVQQVLEEALATALRCPTPITGAGRTDTGVNARVMYAHFDTAEPIPDRRRLTGSLNGIVGRDIAVHDIIPVADDAHARFDATSRTYRYFAHTERSPFLYPFSWHCHHRLDVTAMNEAAERLLHVSDFTSFSKLHSNARTNICHVTRARWEQLDDDRLVFVITADRFLRNMVRAVVGTLVEVGRGKLSLSEFEQIIERRNRCAAGESMPGHALFLWDITYPYPLH